MSLFHRHHWMETGRAFVAPRADLENVRLPDTPRVAEELREALFGATFLSLRCRTCGDVKIRKLTGKFVDATPAGGI